MRPRLSDAALGDLPPGVARPGYDRVAVTPGIVHIGLGAFHRAHGAVMTEAALEAGARDWGIVAASLRSPETRDPVELVARAPGQTPAILACRAGCADAAFSAPRRRRSAAGSCSRHA